MTLVRIPPTLRSETGSRREVRVAGTTVREALSALVETFPGLAGRVLQDGQCAPYLNLFLDGTDVRVLGGLDARVGDESTLLILPAMAGGSLPVRWRTGAVRKRRD